MVSNAANVQTALQVSASKSKSDRLRRLIRKSDRLRRLIRTPLVQGAAESGLEAFLHVAARCPVEGKNEETLSSWGTHHGFNKRCSKKITRATVLKLATRSSRRTWFQQSWFFTCFGCWSNQPSNLFSNRFNLGVLLTHLVLKQSWRFLVDS